MVTKRPKRRAKLAPKTKPKVIGRLNIILDPELKDWAHGFAERNHTTLTALLTGYLVRLRDSERTINVEQI